MASTSPTLSVLITYHDERQMLSECIESLILGSNHAPEILVYDDDSVSDARAFLPRGSAARVIRAHQNIGPSAARNRLLCLATTDYVHFHDADDWFAPGWHDSVSRLLRCKSPDLVVTDVASINEDGVQVDALLGLRAVTPQTLIQRAIRGSLLVPSTTFRRELAISIGGYNEKLVQSEDYDFSIRLCAAAHGVQIMERSLVKIRVHQLSRSRDAAAVFRCALECIPTQSETLKKLYANDFADAAAAMASRLYAVGAASDARAGFALARELGVTSYPGFSRAYRYVAKLLGQECAERIAKIYRLLPTRIRRALRALA